MPTKISYASAVVVALLIVGALAGYALYSLYGTNVLKGSTTQTAYSIQITPLNSSRIATAGSTVDFVFSVTSPRVGPLYFYTSAVPASGAPWQMNLQNITSGNIELPLGVQVSYPTGQAVFGTNNGTLTLRVSFSQTVNGTVGLVVGAVQQLGNEQSVGSGSGFYITVT